MDWLFQLPVLLFSVVVHEFCHGWAAYARGDDTAEKAGRLTLNPVSHVDPFGTLFLPALCVMTGSPVFGWAKPVPYDPVRLKNPRRDGVNVALSGPAGNLVLALAAAVVLKATVFVPALGLSMRQPVSEALFFAVSVNLVLAVFNLIPVHPLDGSVVLGGILPEPFSSAYARLAPYGLFIILILAATGALGALIGPIVGGALRVLPGTGLF